MIPQGIYLGVPTAAECCKAKSGNPQIAIDFEIQSKWDGTDWAPLATKTERTVYLSLTPAAWDWSLERLEKVGFNNDFARPQCNAPDGVIVECRHEAYGGGPTKERWDIQTERKKVERVPVGKDDARMLNAKLKASLAKPTIPAVPAVPAAAPAKPAAAPPVPASPIDDEVPGLTADQIPVDGKDGLPF